MYLNKPAPSKPLRHIGISYVNVGRLGCSRTIHECEMCEFAKKVIFSIGHSVTVTDICVCNWRILDRPSSSPGLWIDWKGRKTKATCMGNWVQVLTSSTKLVRFRSLRIAILVISSPPYQLLWPKWQGRWYRVLAPVKNSKFELTKKWTLYRKVWLSVSERLGLGLKALICKSTKSDNTEKNKNVRSTPEPRARTLPLNNLTFSKKCL